VFFPPSETREQVRFRASRTPAETRRERRSGDSLCVAML
jgi:hypothetical protein